MVDSFIGSVFGNLVVTGIAGRNKHSHIEYSCHCSECAQDPELHGTAIYKSTKFSLVNGQIPCGCSYNPKWSSRQYRVLLKRKAEGKYSVVVPGAKAKGTTKVSCQCNAEGCGHEWEAAIDNLLHGGTGCSVCAGRGYDSSKSGTLYVYLWTHKDTKAQHLKYGISNYPTNRIKQQRRANAKYTAKQLCSIDFQDGEIPKRLEKAIDEYRKTDNIANPVTKDLFPDGHTETLPISCWSFTANLIQSETMCRLQPL